MKNHLLKTALILFLSFTVVATTYAQEEKREHRQGHDWHMGDSTHMKEFSCAMHNHNFDDFPFCRNSNKYNGHWAGFELGFSGYVTPSFDMKFDPLYPYMNMNVARSLTVNINPFELNLNLYHNHIGFTTGLGFQITNYYFTDHYVMLKDSSTLVAFKVQDAQGNMVNMEVNKMVISYLNLPLFFEYQTNKYRHMNSFHVTLGIIAGVRIGTYTKQVYHDEGESYFLVDDKGNKVAAFDVEHECVHDRGTYHLNPFKVDAAFRIGWSHLNLFGTYSMTQMFQSNQGPELYPFTVGITLLGW